MKSLLPFKIFAYSDGSRATKMTIRTLDEYASGKSTTENKCTCVNGLSPSIVADVLRDSQFTRGLYETNFSGQKVVLTYSSEDGREGWMLFLNEKDHLVPGFKSTGPDWGAIERILGERVQ